MTTSATTSVDKAGKKSVWMAGRRTTRIQHVTITASNLSVPLDVARPMVTALNPENANVMRAGKDNSVTNVRSTPAVSTGLALNPGPVTVRRAGVVKCATKT